MAIISGIKPALLKSWLQYGNFTLIATLVGAVAVLLVKYFPDTFTQKWEDTVSYWLLFIPIGFFVVVFIYHLKSCCQEPICLEMEFIQPKDTKDMDFNIHRYLMRVKITHTHPTKSAKNVRVLIAKIARPQWEGTIASLPLKKFQVPHYLQEIETNDGSQKHDLSPKPFAKTFDVFAVRTNPEESEVWIAPFESPDQQHRNHWCKNSFSFSEKDCSNGVGVFSVELQATADDVKTLSKLIVLEVPICTWNLADQYPLKVPSVPPRWVVQAPDA